MLLCSRNARPQKEGYRAQPGSPSCSQRPHIRICSLDARSEGQPGYALWEIKE